jgi:ataxin-3
MNLNKHWLPLRRFAASPNRWYNLNSLLNNPEILPVNLLGLAIETAENEGHSVFVVRKIGSSGQTNEGLSVLPECEADLMGLQFGDPSAQGERLLCDTGRVITWD